MENKSDENADLRVAAFVQKRLFLFDESAAGV